MKRAILTAAVLLLPAGCGVTAGGPGPGGTIPAGQTVQAPARPVGVPAEPAGGELRAAAPAATPAPSRVAPAVEAAPPSVPPEQDGVTGHGCPGGDPPYHKLCPV